MIRTIVKRKSQKQKLRENLGVILVCAAVLLSLPSLLKAQQQITDAQITQAVWMDLLASPAVASHRIDITTSDGIVHLSGKVSSLLEKEKAEDITATIRGVRSIVNQIEVKKTVRSDSQIKSDITQSLLLDPVTEVYEIEVSVSYGMVTLTGSVDSWPERQIAGRIAKSIKGVMDVANNITIDYKQDRPAGEIQAEVKRRLANDPYISDSLIKVDVQDSTVTLSGSVPSLADKRQARNKAWVNGVMDVKAEGLIVDPWLEDQMERKQKFSARTDQQVRNAVNDALSYDPRVRGFEIIVTVDNGVVKLNGTVDNLQAKQSAEDDAQNTIGAWKIKNFIKVRPENPPTDDEIRMSILNSIRIDPVLNRKQITVEVNNNKAYLYGKVDNNYQKQHAQTLASGAVGVIEVDNNIQVIDKWTWKSDTAIRDDVNQQLWWSMLVDSDDINVAVQDAVVTLTGSVNSWQEEQAAIENAFEAGAKSVRSYLSVEQAPDYYPQYKYYPYGSYGMYPSMYAYPPVPYGRPRGF